MTKSYKISEAKTVRDINRCYPVIQTLWPHLTQNEFLSRIKFLRKKTDYHLVFLESKKDIKSVAGYRIFESLGRGKTLYVEDLASKSDERSQGYGSLLMDWIEKKAVSLKCRRLYLDSRVENFKAHRFYIKKGFDITCFRFAKWLCDS